ncbi:hypothetical protein GCM10027085_16970 [Spirosoma aerophilum]
MSNVMKKTAFTLVFFLLVSLACERPESLTTSLPKLANQESLSIADAKNYFIKTVLPSNPSGRVASQNKYERDIDWNAAKKVKQTNGLEVVAAPVIYKTNSRPGVILWDDKTSDDEKRPKIENVLDARECLLTYKDKSGNFQTQIVQYIPSKEYKTKKKGVIADDFSGWVMALTWDEKLITGYEFKNGKDVRQLTTTKAAAGGRLSSCDFTYYQSVTANCYSCGTNCTACDVSVSGGYQGYCTGPSSDSATDPNTNVSYGGQGIYYYTAAAPSDYNYGISCTTFVFTKTTPSWQEAGVKGFYMNIVYWTQQRREVRRYDIPGQVVIGMPLNRSNGQAISTGQAATIAAYIVANASDQTFLEYRDREDQPSDWEVERSFRNNLKNAATAMGIGANASTNGSGSPLILIKQSEFTFLGNGNCDSN